MYICRHWIYIKQYLYQYPLSTTSELQSFWVTNRRSRSATSSAYCASCSSDMVCCLSRWAPLTKVQLDSDLPFKDSILGPTVVYIAWLLQISLTKFPQNSEFLEFGQFRRNCGQFRRNCGQFRRQSVRFFFFGKNEKCKKNTKK